MFRLILAPVFVLAFLVLAPSPALAWSTSQTAKSICENEKAGIDWTFINKESRRSIKVNVHEKQTNQTVSRTVAAGQAASGTFATRQANIQAGQVSFLVKWADGEKGTDTREVSYKKINCEASPVNDKPDSKPDKSVPVEQPLPNTGPLDTFGPFAAFLVASGSAWWMTRQEIIKAAKKV